jgi:hypothetical protein
VSLEVVFSSDAKETLSAMTISIRDRWGISTAEKFVEKDYEKID